MSVSAPREQLEQVAYQTRLFNIVIAFLERTPEFKDAAAAVEAEFVRRVERKGRECPCGLHVVLGPCKVWAPDKSGGFCRRCAHHKDCHRPEKSTAPTAVHDTREVAATRLEPIATKEITREITREITNEGTVHHDDDK